MATAYGYTRCSTQDQKDSGLGLEAQKQEIERHYKYKLEPQAVEWGGMSTDAAVSGNVPFRERPVGRELNERLRSGDHIIIAKLDRGFRRADDACRTVGEWRDRNVTLHVLDVNLDTSTPIGDMVLKILAVVAEWERRRIGERSAAAVKIARERGAAANGFAGYGFKLIGAKGHKRRVADPEERATMKRVVKLRCDSWSWEAIYFDFLKQGIKTREGREWSLSRIYRAFQAELRLMAKEAASRIGNSDASPAQGTTDG
jgi:DNA invertase Pin-like site-specific DNA recombinase